MFVWVCFTEISALKFQGGPGVDGKKGSPGELGRRVNNFVKCLLSLLNTYLPLF